MSDGGIGGPAIACESRVAFAVEESAEARLLRAGGGHVRVYFVPHRDVGGFRFFLDAVDPLVVAVLLCSTYTVAGQLGKLRLRRGCLGGKPEG